MKPLLQRLVSGAVLAAALASPWPASGDSAGDKAVRGLAAMAVPFLEIPGNVIHTSEQEGDFAGWTEGLARGLGMAIIRPPVGFFELVTAPWAVPPNYDPVLRPEYPWSYFDDGYADQPILDTAEGPRWPWASTE